MNCADCSCWGTLFPPTMPRMKYCQITNYSCGGDERCRLEWQIESRDTRNDQAREAMARLRGERE